MKQVIIRDRQTVTDIAIQALGSADAASEIAKLNGLSVTSELLPGSVLILPPVVNRRVAEFFSRNRIYPALKIDTSARPGGIGYMQIGTDFKVS